MHTKKSEKRPLLREKNGYEDTQVNSTNFLSYQKYWYKLMVMQLFLQGKARLETIFTVTTDISTLIWYQH